MALGQLPFLATLARSERPRDRLVWLRVALDYAAELGDSAEIDERFLETFVETMDSLGPILRLDAAKRLVRAPNPPASLLTLLLAYGGEAAIEILEYTTHLPAEALAAALEDVALSAALAKRDDLSPDLIDALLARGDIPTLKALVANPVVELAGASLAKLARAARDAAIATGDRNLAEATLARWSHHSETASLFLYATPAQRSSLLLAAQRADLGRPRNLDRADIANPWLEDLEAFALAGRIDAFSTALAKALGCSPALAEDIANDRSGEALVAALVAIGAPADVSVRILTSSDMRDGADYRRVGALARLQDSLSRAAARRLIAAMIDAPAPAENSQTAGNAWRPGERRLRTTPILRDDPASVRRRRAFSMLVENRKL